MFNRYFQSELTYLRELGQEFADQNPDLAGVFAAKGADPDVERLLEGVAFLTARIRERIDDAVPELIESLSQLVLPHYARPLPSATVVEFMPNMSTLRGRHTIPVGTELGARPVRGTSCTYRTTLGQALLPLTIESCSLDQSEARAPVIRVGMRTTEAGKAAVHAPGAVRLHLGGPLPHASTLFLWLMRHLDDVHYENDRGERVRLGPGCERPVCLGPDEGLLPWPELSPEGPRLLQEYFTLPESLLFVDFEGLDRIDSERATERFELHLRCTEPPALPERLEREHVRLHCAPAVNLFEVGAEPIRRDPGMHEYLLRASGVDPLAMEVYEVRQVTGLRAQRRDRLQYSRFFDFRHTRKPQSEQTYYTVRRAPSPLDAGFDTYLSVLTPRDASIQADGLGEETLSIDLTCTNRALPTELRVGDVSVPTPRSPTVARFRNITRVTAPVHPPIGQELHWRLLSHLGLNMRTLGQADTLGALLELYTFHGGDRQHARANEMRAGSVRDVRIESGRRTLDNAVVRGLRVGVTVDESQFVSVGDAFLLGCALDALFGAQAPINSYTQLQLTLHPSMTELQWAPKNGTQPLL
jgi:type VI secretion system protein ImpG